MKCWLVGCAMGLAMLRAWSVAVAAAPRDLVPLKGNLIGAVARATRLSPHPHADDGGIGISVVLNWSDSARFEQFASQQEALMARGQFRPMSPQELTARFGPSRESYRSVLSYLRKAGFVIVGESNNRLTIAAKGTRAQAQRAFGVQIDDYRLGRRLFYANDRDPMVPRSLAPVIRSLSGLSNFHRWRRAGSPPDPSSAVSIRVAYGVNGLVPPPDGAGQVIGILAFNDYNEADIKARLELTGVPAAPMLARLHRFLANGPQPADWEPELDIDGAMNVAPGASSFNVFIGPNAYASFDLTTEFAPLFNFAVEKLPTGNVARVLSFSYLDCESAFSMAELGSVDGLILLANLEGISFFAASGDSGAVCANDIGPSETGPSFPASASHTVAVGGTTLSVGAAGGYESEAWWNNDDGAGGYGISAYFPKPPFQAPFTSVQNRSLPDVAAFADPGIDMCWGGCGLAILPGTSLATPLWAGMWTLVAQTCGPSFNVASNSFLYSLPNHAFHSAQSMVGPNNDFAHVGLGSPNLSEFCCGAFNQSCCGAKTCNTDLTCSTQTQTCVSGCGGKSELCCHSAVNAVPLTHSGGLAGWCRSGLSCANDWCTCGGKGQACCIPNGTCNSGLTCTNLVCVQSSGQSCSKCAADLAQCLAGCATDPHHANYCSCECKALSCSCRKVYCGIEQCQSPACDTLN
jgi:hypothetical protein